MFVQTNWPSCIQLIIWIVFVLNIEDVFPCLFKNVFFARLSEDIFVLVS